MGHESVILGNRLTNGWYQVSYITLNTCLEVAMEEALEHATMQEKLCMLLLHQELKASPRVCLVNPPNNTPTHVVYLDCHRNSVLDQ